MWRLVITVYFASLVICEAQILGETQLNPCIYTDPVCPNKDITFWLYTRATRDNPILLTAENFKDAPYNNTASFVVIIHGYTSSKDRVPNPELRKALFDKDDYNIISVDYAPIAQEPCYVQAVSNIKTVANCTAILLLKMIESIPNVINIDNLHVIGHSLGAHAVGIMGSYFKSLGNTTLKWLTGLDPASPLFETVDDDLRISACDADFVDVYHTDCCNKGIIEPAGTVDFYLNNGYDQPGCGSNSNCDHVRSVLYYAESINRSSIGFWGAPCSFVGQTTDICKAPNGEETTELMGYYTHPMTVGTYQVKTNSAPPFALGKNP